MESKCVPTISPLNISHHWIANIFMENGNNKRKLFIINMFRGESDYYRQCHKATQFRSGPVCCGSGLLRVNCIGFVRFFFFIRFHLFLFIRTAICWVEHKNCFHWWSVWDLVALFSLTHCLLIIYRRLLPKFVHPWPNCFMYKFAIINFHAEQETEM